MPTENTRLTFGKNKGLPLKHCEDDYLKWMVGNLAETDFAEWVEVARKVLKDRETSGDKVAGSLEQQADAILRANGYGGLVQGQTRRFPIRRRH